MVGIFSYVADRRIITRRHMWIHQILIVDVFGLRIYNYIPEKHFNPFENKGPNKLQSCLISNLFPGFKSFMCILVILHTLYTPRTLDMDSSLNRRDAKEFYFGKQNWLGLTRTSFRPWNWQFQEVSVNKQSASFLLSSWTNPCHFPHLLSNSRAPWTNDWKWPRSGRKSGSDW